MAEENTAQPRNDKPQLTHDAARRQRRENLLRELHEARELLARVHPRRTRTARMRQAMRRRSFRW